MLDRANRLLANKKYREAKNEYLACVDQTEDKVSAYLGLASSHYYLEEYQEAETCARQSLEIGSNLHKAHSMLAYILARQGKLEESETEILIALKILPSDPETLAIAGGIFVAQSKLDDGLNFLHKSLELNPVNWLAHYHVGHAYFLQKKYKNATQEFLKSFRLKMSFSSLTNFLVAIVNECRFAIPFVLAALTLVGLITRSLSLLLIPSLLLIFGGSKTLATKNRIGFWMILAGSLPLLIYFLIR